MRWTGYFKGAVCDWGSWICSREGLGWFGSDLSAVGGGLGVVSGGLDILRGAICDWVVGYVLERVWVGLEVAWVRLEVVWYYL